MPTTMLRGSVPVITPSLGNGFIVALARGVRFVEAAMAVAGERHRLASLDERMLKDIGLSRSLADQEASRDFLDVPAHRIRRS